MLEYSCGELKRGKSVQEKSISATTYICENCGKEYHDKRDIVSCFFSGKEMCPNCWKEVNLAETDIEDDDCSAILTKMVVHPSLIAKGYVKNEEIYLQAMRDLKKAYIDKAKELTVAYLQNRLHEIGAVVDIEPIEVKRKSNIFKMLWEMKR